MSRKTKKKSRHIPNKIQRKVKERHFFECAWCCTGLTEQHHIEEFANDGAHTEDNLILLCPNCHTEVHKNDGNIKLEDLLLRKSTHFKGDRVAGNAPFDITENKIKFGDLTIKDFNPYLSFNKENVISLENNNGQFYLNCRFYNQNGELVFWMSKNRYFAPETFKVTYHQKSLEISNDKNINYYLKVWQIDDYLNIIGTNYYKGSKVIIKQNELKIGNTWTNITLAGKGTIQGNGINGFINL